MLLLGFNILLPARRFIFIKPVLMFNNKVLWINGKQED
jgi:hypothetical protein